jgi:hypothetical protein
MFFKTFAEKQIEQKGRQYDRDIRDERHETERVMAEMLRYLPLIERAEADPALWARLTAGTGIATANGYRAAVGKATAKPSA